jgi:hypothetical protein
VSRIEHGQQSPTPDDVETWCKLTGADEQLPDILASLHNVEGMYVDWQRLERSGMGRLQEQAEPLCERTRTFRIYEPGVIPGLFQTPPYLRATLTRLATFDRAPGGVDEAVAARVERQQLLNSRDRRFVAVIEEAALLARMTDVETMAGQLGHLITVASLPNVSVGIIPSNVERVRWQSAAFWMFDDECVQIETPSALITITQPSEIDVYGRAFAEFSAMAVRGAQARLLVMAAMERLSA